MLLVRPAFKTQSKEKKETSGESDERNQKTCGTPSPNTDFYQLLETLPADQLAVVIQVRTFMETKVAPIVTKYWVEDSFPFELLPAIKELNIGGVAMNGYGAGTVVGNCLGWSLWRWRARCLDRHILGVHNGLAMGSSIWAVQKNKSKNGCRRWPAGKKLAALV